ncbi:MAG: hypothetical protein MZV63_37290 [Marinilabiliales bacterium]|nr:hypothetical protein [Marinilabiliales bacterium]
MGRSMFHSEKSTATMSGTAGDRGDKDKNIPEICNDRGKMLKPLHH